MRPVLRFALIAASLLVAAAAGAATTTPVGTWTQVDDATGKPKSIIEITQQPDGTLQGVVKTVLLSDQGPNPVCEECEGERHNKPVEGMTIMWGVKKTGENEWSDGQILDPGNGKTYKVKLSLKDNGQKLDVRGYVGLSLFGRTQTWNRKSEPEPAPKPEPAMMGHDMSTMPAPAATSPGSSTPEPSPAATSGSSSY